MKRDLDLVRQILIAMESGEHGFVGDTFTIEDYSDEQIGYHVFLMADAGLISALDATTISDESPSAIPKSITWAGHDFLDSVRDETVWKKACSMVINPTVGVAFDVLIAWLKEEARRRLWPS